jgi:hypothetical protein
MRVNDLRKKCTAPAVIRIANFAKSLYVKWKKVYEDAQVTKPSEGSQSSPVAHAAESSAAGVPLQTAESASKEVPPPTGSPAQTTAGEISISHFADLGEGRRNVCLPLLKVEYCFNSLYY